VFEGDGRGGARRRPAIRPQDQRLHEAVARERGDVFERAVDAIAVVSQRLLGELVTTVPPKDREVEA
jgi:hypothetical protein